MSLWETPGKVREFDDDWRVASLKRTFGRFSLTRSNSAKLSCKSKIDNSRLTCVNVFAL